MAAIDVSDCTVKVRGTHGLKIIEIVTPATADDGDTIDLSDYFSSLCFAVASSTTDLTLLCTATVMGTSITIPGGTDDEARTIFAFGN